MITQRRYLIQHPAFITLFVFNLLTTTFLLFIDEGNYSFVEFQHFHTWVILLAYAGIFTFVSGMIYLVFDRMTNLEMIVKIILAISLMLPFIICLLYLLNGLVQLLS